jgi:hypothetical protein
MCPFFFNSFFILVQYVILKLNVSSHPPVYEKDTATPPLILATSRHCLYRYLTNQPGKYTYNTSFLIFSIALSQSTQDTQSNQ